MAIARQTYDAFSRNDWVSFVEFIHPNVEFESAVLEIEGGGFAATPARGSTSIPCESSSAESSLDRPPRGRESGARVAQSFWQAGETRGGKVVWWKFCRTRAEALEAVAAREQDV